MTHYDFTHIEMTVYVCSIPDMSGFILDVPTSVVTPSYVVLWRLCLSECCISYVVVTYTVINHDHNEPL